MTKRVANMLMCAALLCTLATASWADHRQCTVRSPAETVALLELYTSEGCSSCPPAEKWLSELRGRAGEELRREGLRFVPLALHVDYWDHLGWKDHFASPTFSDRQRSLSRMASAKFVYTPEVFISGQETRTWGTAASLKEAIRRVNRQQAMVNIELRSDLNARMLQVAADFTVPGAPRQPRLEAYIALFENGLSTDVKAGENSGRMLAGDYVVRRWIGPIELGAGTSLYRGSVELGSDWKQDRIGLAAFVQEARSGKVVQALASDLCRS